MAGENLLSVAEAAAILGVSPKRVQQFCQRGRLGSKWSGRWVIADDELRQFAKIPRKTGWPAGVSRKSE